MNPIDRRTFLRASLAGAGALALGACTRRTPRVFPSPFASMASRLSRNARLGLQVFPGGQEFIAGSAQRLTLGLADAGGATIQGQSVRVWVGQASMAAGPYVATYEAYHRTAPGDPLGFFKTTLEVFPWTGLVDVMAQTDAGLYGFATIQARTTPVTVGVGRRAIPFATPTVGHPRGVKHVCTRTPPCAMHTQRLDQVLGDGTPLVFTIASPKLCSSRTCGPVVDEILDVRRTHAGRAHFIHAEVYAGDTATTLSPVASAWNIQSEPWTWVIDGTGVVRTRFEGPVVAAEIEPALRALI